VERGALQPFGWAVQDGLAGQTSRRALLRSKKPSVLVVEDNEINALLSRVLPTRLSHRPAVGAAALETWQAARAAGTP